jgi:hypothetical protein
LELQIKQHSQSNENQRTELQSEVKELRIKLTETEVKYATIAEQQNGYTQLVQKHESNLA